MKTAILAVALCVLSVGCTEIVHTRADGSVYRRNGFLDDYTRDVTTETATDGTVRKTVHISDKPDAETVKAVVGAVMDAATKVGAAVGVLAAP